MDKATLNGILNAAIIIALSGWFFKSIGSAIERNAPWWAVILLTYVFFKIYQLVRFKD